MSYFLIIIFFCPFFLLAQDFGTYGTTFSIDEDDLIVVLQERLKKTQYDESKKMEIQKVLTKAVEEPKGKILPRANIRRCFDFDPTLLVKEEVKDQNGELIIRKGMKVNPLDSSTLAEQLLIFDANDPKQILWAKNIHGIWILTNGSPLELEKQENRPVYFDQAGYLTTKLGITSLPAIVTQEDKKLKVEETPCF